MIDFGEDPRQGGSKKVGELLLPKYFFTFLENNVILCEIKKFVNN